MSAISSQIEWIYNDLFRNESTVYTKVGMLCGGQYWCQIICKYTLENTTATTGIHLGIESLQIENLYMGKYVIYFPLARWI